MNSTATTSAASDGGAADLPPPANAIFASELGGFGPMNAEEMTLEISGLNLRVGALEAWISQTSEPGKTKRNGN